MHSRRQFLAHSAAATAMMMLPPDFRLSREPVSVIVDLGAHCSLHESLAGYLACNDDSTVILSAAKDLTSLVDSQHLTSDARSFASLRMAGSLVIPAVTHIDSSTAQLILSCLHRGGTVLLESGAMFGDYRAHREQLREYFQILVEPPVELWPARGIPYIEYRWPIPIKVRDFSRVIPLAPQRGAVIARVNDIPVALARRVGPGILIFLGSPLGPALWADDAGARRWLGTLVSLGAQRQT